MHYIPRLMSAGPAFFLSAWFLMLFAGAVSGDVGTRPFGYLTAMVVTIALWIGRVPATGAVARPFKSKQPAAKNRPAAENWTSGDSLDRCSRIFVTGTTVT